VVKSSLAFDTIYNEGNVGIWKLLCLCKKTVCRRYGKADVDKITGLSPVISMIKSHNGSTVGTITEIYDFSVVVCQGRRKRTVITPGKKNGEIF
jgi:excinuclease UvrABC ATPase subunit